MRFSILTKIVANFFAVVFLVGLLLVPLLFVNNFAKVAGVKSQSQYLVVSQIDKFPNLTLSQSGETYKISYQKYSESQAFLSALILNNPTSKSQKYTLKSTENNVFFGEDLENKINKILVPSNSSVPISFLIKNSSNEGSIEISIEVN